MAYRKNSDIRQEVDELYYMYDYLYTYIEDDYKNPDYYLITYDANNKEGRQANQLHELITGEYKNRPVSEKILHTFLGGASNGLEDTTPYREKMLKVYRKLKSNDDFNNPEKAPEYAKQIVDSYSEKKSSYPYIFGVTINQQSVPFRVCNEKKLFNFLNVDSEEHFIEHMKRYTGLLTLEFQGKHIDLPKKNIKMSKEQERYFLDNYGLLPILN